MNLRSLMMYRVVYIVEDMQFLQFRYRVKNVVGALRESRKWEGEWCLKKEILGIDLGEVDILVISRQTAKDGAVLKLIRRAHERGVKVLFDLDDLIFDYKDLCLVVRSVGEKSWLYWMGYIWGIRRIAKKVDGFLCTNEFLAGKLKRSFKKPAKIIPNSLNQEQVETSETIIKEKKMNKNFMIGYFSGSPTHEKDFRVVEPELIKFMETYDDVILKVVGDMKFSQEMNKWIKLGRVKVRKKVDYLKLQKLIAEVDVNIAPLVINDFTNCKSELKFFEAGVVETTTIASPVYAFKKAIKDGENGFLARPGEWYGKLEYLYKHPEENQKIAKRAREYALKHYYGKEFLREAEEAYDYFGK